MVEVKMTLEEYQDLEDKLSTLARENHNLKQERDAYKKQRDELINDMAEIKKKAEAWDKLKEYVLDRNEAFSDRKDCAQSPQQFEYFENLLTAFKVIKTKMNDLERGSDENQ